MLLAIDVGNSNIVIGVIDGDTIIHKGRMHTNIQETTDEYAIKLHSFLQLRGVVDKIDGAIIASVVPPLIRSLKKAVKLVTGQNALVVGPGIKTGLSIMIDDPSELGADMVVGAVAAKEKYPCPLIIFDLGTATTGSVIDKNGNFIGAVITAGVKTSLNALASGTALLPLIDISAPKKVIGTNTIDSMRSGAVIGTAAMIDGLIDKFEAELGEKATVIITGGLGTEVSKNCVHEVVLLQNLLLDGLKIIYDKNK